MRKHTPGPWEVREGTKHYQFDIVANIDGEKKRIFIDNHYGNAEANAAFIVKACNLHDELVEALKAYFDDDVVMQGSTSKAEKHNKRYETTKALIAKIDGD